MRLILLDLRKKYYIVPKLICMKPFVIIGLLFLSVFAYSQDANKKLQKIKTEDQANAYAKENKNANVKTLLSVKDTSDVAKEIYASRKGDILMVKNYSIKIIETKTETIFKVMYVYLDGSKLSIETIDSVRTMIISKYEHATPFIDLVKEYSMDGNPTGEFGWVTSEMAAKEFSAAVLSHKKDDIFTVNVPRNKWYYVVLKTYEDQKSKVVTVLTVKNEG